MTQPNRENYVPTMDEAKRFIDSNPATSWEMLIARLAIGDEDKSGASGGRLRELWKLAGGMVDKSDRAWVEVQTLPSVLRKVIDAVKQPSPELPDRSRAKLEALHREIGAWEMDGPDGATTVAEFIDA